MQTLPASLKDHRVKAVLESDVCGGEVRWAPAKSLWFAGMTLVGFVGGPLMFTWTAFSVFLASTAFVLLLGHSVGMHRRLIHGSFQCPLWLEYFLVYCGTLVGIAGPLGLLRTHDMRDFAQRQSRCHDYFAHRQPALIDHCWQVHCDLELARPPRIVIENRIADDPVYRFLEKTWMWQQLPWALLCFWLGGWSMVCWAACARVSICVFGHWLVGFFAHRKGFMHYEVEGETVQGHNVRFCALLTMGESLHNNHHAFPGSARLGIAPGEWDPGWWFLKALEYIGLAWQLRTPADLPYRAELKERAVVKNTCLLKRVVKGACAL
jgi:sn-1 stearoyl-lipid 9-desaturase